MKRERESTFNCIYCHLRSAISHDALHQLLPFSSCYLVINTVINTARLQGFKVVIVEISLRLTNGIKLKTVRVCVCACVGMVDHTNSENYYI